MNKQVTHLHDYLAANPELATIEILTPDMCGILRAKRVPRAELESFFTQGLTGPGTTCIMNSLGDCGDIFGDGQFDGDPDKAIHPVVETLAPIPWLTPATHQMLAHWTELDGTPLYWNSREVLRRATQPLLDMGYRVVVATELEFYALADGDQEVPQPRLGTVLGTSTTQQGTQYCNPEDMAEYDSFLEGIRLACESQHIPATTAHLEFAPGQFEINLHHTDDVVAACDHALLLKRAIKGVGWQHGMGVTFMAKPFAELPGSGLHIHVSIYDEKGDNIFVDPSSTAVPPFGAAMRHAIAGLAQTMSEAQAMFAPNANSYRRLQPGYFAPLTPNWGYNHRDVALRIPVSSPENLRIEHRVAGADANPYLVLACILAGIHHGLQQQDEPPAPVKEGEVLDDQPVTLATSWHQALDTFKRGEILKRYLGEAYWDLYYRARLDECNLFQKQVSNIDYSWYLRSV
ncbi:MAG: glutamine synthetase family protein [Halieaceae bacterium]|jgi:glutamine synthetase|nr:glutamine synthetase family protein [Halieaceae bacterium]